MGIRGLTGWIQWAAAKALKQPNWSSFKGKRVGIDILGFLYKAKARGVHPVTYIAHLIAQCRIHSIQPIPIFDGKPPDEKRDIIRLRNEARLQNDQKRKDLANSLETTDMTADQKNHCAKEMETLAASSVYITTEERDEVKRFLYACGVKFLNANGHFTLPEWVCCIVSLWFSSIQCIYFNLRCAVFKCLPHTNIAFRCVYKIFIAVTTTVFSV